MFVVDGRSMGLVCGGIVSGFWCVVCLIVFGG